ncbi:tetratricopeptide repeat protein [Fodinibius sp.]|uniref:tetratricopeptide repeat protein n=1 Tax=Fodinibius sp. TaxID=1872440 RepID=UPI002ACD9C93|nr:tetratricopeptide repeat protein [Fodinibius sp.]MDZ7659776.1 tetratricopeptide repeat protein [Fodinibius sp.]
MTVIRLTWLFILCSIISNSLFAAPTEIHADSSSYEQKLEDGIDAFYRADWIEAKAVFKELQQKKPGDSRAYFFESMIPFWKYYFGDQSSKAAETFLDQSKQAIKISKQQLSENSSDTTMVLMLSGLYGYRSLVAAAEKNYKEALQSGMTGFKYTRQLLALDADDPKALIGKGMFYYMVGSVPNGLKWATNMIGMSADMQEGFEVLEQAARSDSYVRNDAQMILAYLYEREQKNEKALKHLEALSERYPGNIIFQYNRARLLEKTNKLDRARENYQMVATMDTNTLDILKQKSKNRLHKL